MPLMTMQLIQRTWRKCQSAGADGEEEEKLENMLLTGIFPFRATMMSAMRRRVAARVQMNVFSCGVCRVRNMMSSPVAKVSR